MIELGSSEWTKLQHAYGSASDIPSLLRQLETYPESKEYSEEPYFSLWSSLCHQGDTCNAAYASVPHILTIAKEEPKKINYQFILLPISIELARAQGRGPELSEDLEFDYLKSINSIPALIAKLNKNQMNETMAITCSAAIALVSGYEVLAEAILELEGDSAKEFLEWKLHQ